MEKKKKYRLFGDDGFTLIETLVALVSLGLFFVSLVVILQSVTNVVIEAKTRAGAIALANDKMEEVRNLAYDDVGTVGGIPNGVIPQSEVIVVNGQEYKVDTTIVYVDDAFDDQAPIDPIPTDYKSVTIAVNWEGVNPSKSPVYLVANVAPDGLEMDAGGGILQVEVINASGEPVAGASVNIVNNLVVPNINIDAVTDSKGKLSFPGAPECIGECYEISATKNGYSTDRTYSTSEVTNPNKPHATVLSGQVTSITLQVDVLSDLTFYVTGSRENGYPPFMGVEFTLQGAKTIGTDASDQDVYKYMQNHVSLAGGLVTINDIEWDVYTIIMPEGSSVDFAGSVPTNPFSLLPGQNLSVKLVTSPASNNTVLVITKDASETLIASASVTLKGPLSFIATKSGGLSGKGDHGQVLFSNLSAGSYDFLIQKPGYLEATGSSQVNGDLVELFVLDPE